MWAKDAGTPTVPLCTGATKSWQDALNYVACLNTNTYLGHSDWRLPNIKELRSLTNYQQSDLSVWQAVQGFINVSPNEYWSSTTGSGVNQAFNLITRSGEVQYNSKTDLAAGVWPVRTASAAEGELPKTGQVTSYDANVAQRDDGAIKAGVAWPGTRFVLNTGPSGTTITDYLTGLTWAQDAGTPTAGSCAGGDKSRQTALSYVACLNALNYLGASDWRVPNANEMETLVNYGAAGYAAWLNGNGFTNVALVYMTSTTSLSYASSPLLATMEGDLLRLGSNVKVLPVRGGR